MYYPLQVQLTSYLYPQCTINKRLSANHGFLSWLHHLKQLYFLFFLIYFWCSKILLVQSGKKRFPLKGKNGKKKKKIHNSRIYESPLIAWCTLSSCPHIQYSPLTGDHDINYLSCFHLPHLFYFCIGIMGLQLSTAYPLPKHGTLQLLSYCTYPAEALMVHTTAKWDYDSSTSIGLTCHTHVTGKCHGLTF